MGLFSDKPKYIKAYQSIKHIYSIINSNSDRNIEVYFIKYENIHEFHNILKNNDIFDLIPNIKKRAEVEDKKEKISDAFSDYKKEKNIEVIEGPKLNNGKYSMKIRNDTKYIEKNDDFGNINFIMVDNDFIYNMDIKDKDNVKNNKDKYKVKISVINKEIQIDQEPDKNDNIIIIKEKEHNKGVYNFELKQCKEDFNGDSSVEGDEEVEEPKKEEENILNNTIDNTTDTNNNNVPIAKLSDIVKLISSSILNKSEVEIESIIDIYMEANIGKINNELEKKEETINNIITAVNSIKDYYKNQIQIEVENTRAIRRIGSDYYENNRNEESLNLIGESINDIGNLIDDTSNDNNNGIQNLNQNCFEFRLFKLVQCSNSLCKEKIKDDGKNKLNKYPIILNNDIRSIDEIFLTKEKCQFCNQNNSMICTYKFISIPNILILKFDIQKNNPQKYFKVDVENNIDLKKHLKENVNVINKTKYTLLKTLYAFKSDNDNKLYENIQNSDENKYIPYLVFYKQES